MFADASSLGNREPLLGCERLSFEHAIVEADRRLLAGCAGGEVPLAVLRAVGKQAFEDSNANAPGPTRCNEH
jgi:hypothetical protein